MSMFKPYNALGTSVSLRENNVNINNQMNTTAKNDFSGRVSFCGDIKQEAAHTIIDKIVKNKGFAWFCNLAHKNSAVAEAVQCHKKILIKTE